MPWPTPQDYNEAIQNPQWSFDDPTLKAGTPELTSLGLPRPITGGFASVYRIRCGQQDWAVRCFLRDFPDQQRRYAAISSHLAAVKLPYTVGFEFLPQGIKIRGLWYPILKMEWVEGELLNDYIKKHVLRSSTLLTLANRWIAMARALQQAFIAHGDLQHGNVLVVNDDLRLIDYDGMFVPALAGQISHEVGHRNYQHPLRTEFDFGPSLDLFSEWVIYISLVFLSIDPTLWARVGAGDEFLLFRKEDFDRPDTSATFALLEKHPDSRIQSIITLFRSFLYLGIQQIPVLDSQGHGGSSTTTIHASSSSTPAWWEPPGSRQTASIPRSPSSTSISNTASSSANFAWIFDHITQSNTGVQKSFRFLRSPRLCMVFTFALLCMSILLVELPVQIVLSVLGILLEGLLLVFFYRREPAVQSLRPLLDQKSEQVRSLQSLEQELKYNESQKTQLRAQHDKEKDRLTKRKNDLSHQERQEQNDIQVKLKAALDSINRRRQTINQEEAEALRKALLNIDSRIADLDRQISSLSQTEIQETTKALQTLQNHFIKDYLQRYTIAGATIPGVGSVFTSRLRAARFVTAADVDFVSVQRVQGVGPTKASMLTHWKHSLESKARATMPTTLSPSEHGNIKAKYETKKRQLESRRNDVQRNRPTEESIIRSKYRTAWQSLDSEGTAASTKAAQELLASNNRYAQQYAAISQDLALSEKEFNEESKKIDDKFLS